MTPSSVLDLVAKLLDAILDVVTPDVAQQLLTDAAVRRQNAIADGAEREKFGFDP